MTLASTNSWVHVSHVDSGVRFGCVLQGCPTQKQSCSTASSLLNVRLLQFALDTSIRHLPRQHCNAYLVYETQRVDLVEPV
jgi:hypothetical protein